MSARDLLLHAWTWRPAVAAILAIALGAHVARFRLASPLRTLALAGAAIAVILALASPIDALASGTLFSAHMLQHMLLALVAPPLALLALPGAAERGNRETRRGGAENEKSLLSLLPSLFSPLYSSPPAAATWAMGVGAMWIWHAPTLCNAAATSDAVRALQNLSLPVLGAAFWWPVLGPGRRLPDLTAALYLFTACVACTVLGVSIALSPVTVCAAYGHGADPLGALPLVRGQWGITPAVDQQIGGLLMWVPGCTAYAAAILAVLGRYYAAPHVKAEAS